MEPRCGKLHHVHLLNEALWLSTDFSEERKWKKEIASKLARAAQVYLITRHEWNQQFQHFEEQLRMRNAARVAKIVKDWWNGVHQNLNVLRMKLYHKRWEHACKENQGSVAHFSDMGPSWLGAINYDLEDDGFHESDIPQSLHDERILSHVDGDADVDDKDWKPDVEYDGTIKLDSSSRSTSSSLAASFMDDSDTSGLGVAVYSSPDHLSPEYHSPEISSTCLTACYQEKKQSGSKKKRKTQEEQSHASDYEPQDDVSEESRNTAPTETRLTSLSPNSCDCSIESAEVKGLMSDMKVPLGRFLEPYFQQGWYIKDKVTSMSEFCSSDSDIANLEDDCHMNNKLSKRIQKELSILQSEADAPLLEVLPNGYIDFLASIETEKCCTEQTVQSPLQKSPCDFSQLSEADSKIDNGDVSSSLEGNTANLDTGDIGIVQADTVSSSSEESSLMHIDSNECDQLSEDEFITNSRMVRAPWCSTEPLSESSQLIDLHTAAVELIPLKLTSIASTNPTQSVSEAYALAYGPTLRIRSLPTPNLGAAVTWIRHAFARSIPVLLLTNNHLSGDAELAVAAHLGLLAVADPRYYIPPEHLSNELGNNSITGEWGPHLIVTPRLCLPAWQRRLQMWCPGLRVICLGLARKIERSGTGHRLRDSVARGAVNICLTSYSALRSRPSRFSRIQWSSVIFDQIHLFVNKLSEDQIHGDFLLKIQQPMMILTFIWII
ncbi:unnamed protein product [Heterobilharzia americana]|nr:unnamed protein product [Heterobilharzia americana]